MLRPASVCSTLGCPNASGSRARPLGPGPRCHQETSSTLLEAPSPGLEPELSEPKSEVLPITPRRIAHRCDFRRCQRRQHSQRCRRLPTGPTQTDTLVDVAGPDKGPDKAPENPTRVTRARMTGTERRHQLIGIARSLFAERGYDGRRSKRSRSAPTYPSRSSTNISVARRACTRWWSIGRCRRCWTESPRR